MIEKINSKNSGYLLIQVIVFGAIAVYILGALIGWTVTNLKLSNKYIYKESAFQIAEAGIDYYRWHLNKDNTDYQDDTDGAGPYIHHILDRNNNIIGQFTLEITPPSSGSNLVTIKSTGQTEADQNISKTIIAKLAKPAFTKYALISNNDLYFDEQSEFFGAIHSNGGIHFDGVTHNTISSALIDYDDSAHSDHFREFGIHTHTFPTDPLPPTIIPFREDIFEIGRQFPVSEISFSNITNDLIRLKSEAETDGFYLTNSEEFGYHLVLKTNNTLDLYKINELVSKESCSNETWSIEKETFINNQPFPNNGIFFLEDDIWVNGQIDKARLTIVAASLPDELSTRKNITLNDNLLYTNYTGSDTIGLVAQNNINVGLESENVLQIDAAMVAQSGRVGRPYYNENCSPVYYKREKITLFGMIATNLQSSFSYTNENGYEKQNLNYDNNLLLNPPPSFPLLSDKYKILSWKELK